MIVILNHMIAVASATYGNLTENSSHEQCDYLFAVVGVSLKQRLKLYCFSVSKNDSKE